MLASDTPSSRASGTCKMRAAPGLEDCMRPCASSTITPEVRLSKMICRFSRAELTWTMLVSTAARASASCCVISANERVRPPNSSLLCRTALGVKSPAATCRTPSANNNKGAASCAPRNTARSTALNTAKKRLKVSVPMYMRRKPSRANALF